MNSSSVLRYLVSSFSFYSVLTRALGCQPNCERKEHTPITLARFSLLMPFSLASTSKVAALFGTSLTTNWSLVSLCAYSPTKYLLLLMSWRY